MNTTALVPLAITAGVLWAAWKYGNGAVAGLALGAAGFIIANQIPVVRDGLNQRLVA